MKILIYIITISIFLASCSGSKFLNRKYTAGRFIEHNKTLKHNTIYSDNAKSYASVNNNIELQKTVAEFETEKEIINAKLNSIIKKDSIIHIRRRGQDRTIIIKNNLPDVSVTVDENYRVIRKKTVFIDHAKVKAKKERKIKNCSTIALVCSLIPVLGFVFAIHTKKLIKKYRAEYNSNEFDSYMNIANLALGISIIPSLFAVLIVVAFALLVIALAFGGGAIGSAML